MLLVSRLWFWLLGSCVVAEPFSGTVSLLRASDYIDGAKIYPRDESWKGNQLKSDRVRASGGEGPTDQRQRRYEGSLLEGQQRPRRGEALRGQQQLSEDEEDELFLAAASRWSNMAANAVVNGANWWNLLNHRVLDRMEALWELTEYNRRRITANESEATQRILDANFELVQSMTEVAERLSRRSSILLARAAEMLSLVDEDY